MLDSDRSIAKSTEEKYQNLNKHISSSDDTQRGTGDFEKVEIKKPANLKDEGVVLAVK